MSASGMHYEGYCIRPPSEAESILLQVTTGCSHNKCTFCGSYKGKRFRIKDWSIIEEDIQYAARHMRDRKRLFLMDGDCLILPQAKLLRLLDLINAHLPWLQRIGTYANAKSIRKKSLQELQELRARGLSIVYLGLESGSDQVLKQVKKGSSSQEMVQMGQRVKEAGITLSVTVLLGLAGRQGWAEHARATGEVLSKMDPDYVGALTVMLIPGTELYQDYQAGRFELPGQMEILQELRLMLQSTWLSQGLFISNHASNYLPIKVKFPEGKEQGLQMIDQALQGEVGLKPEWMRAL
ncbi:MAG: radical SAM protein [Desulfohalobiaceae bacterium]